MLTKTLECICGHEEKEQPFIEIKGVSNSKPIALYACPKCYTVRVKE